MPTKYIELFNGSQEERRRIALAEALTQQSLGGAPAIDTRGWNQSRITPTYGLGHGLVDAGAKIGAAVMARNQTRRADAAALERENAQRAQFGLPPIPAESPKPSRRAQILAAALKGEQVEPEPAADPYEGLAARLPIPQGLNAEAAYEYFKRDPEGYFAALIQQQRGGQTPAELQTFNAMTEGMTPEEIAQARRVQLGLQSRAGQGRVTNVNGVPTYVGMGDDGQPLQIPISSLGSEAGAAQTLAQAQSLGSGRGQNQAALERTVGERGTNAGNTLAMLDIAEPLLDVATGSGAGAARDAVAAFFGEATDGAQATAQLQVLQAGLMLNMPRMEGPQSDRDTELYRQAAAQIGNPNIPTPTRKAAVQTIRAIQQRYAERAQSGLPEVVPRGQMPDFRNMSDEELRRIASGG